MYSLFLSLIFLIPFLNGAQPYEEAALIRKKGDVALIVPKAPLAPGSVAIVSENELLDFVNWTPAMLKESFSLIHYTVQTWSKKGIEDYLLLGKVDPNEKTPFFFELIPYEKSLFPFWSQLKVLFNLLFGTSLIEADNQKRRVADFLDDRPSPLQGDIPSLEKLHDPFLDPNTIDRQWVIVGKNILVLYNYAPMPLGERSLHFLLIPKEPRLRTIDMTEEEFVEAELLSQRLIRFYREKGYPIAYLFSKTGVLAGQTVPHWHQHLLFAEDTGVELYGKLYVLKNMLFGTPSLSSDELKKRVDLLRKELQGIKEEVAPAF